MAVAQQIYALALFDAAKERGQLPAVRDEFGDFVAMLQEVPELDGVLRNPQLDPRAKAAVLEDLFADSGDLLRNFLRLLVEKGRAPEIAGIHREFEELWRREQGILEVELTTAVDLTDEERRSLIDQIREASGRRIEATSKVDPDLIGGIVLQAGSLRVDASVRGRIERLRHELATSRD